MVIFFLITNLYKTYTNKIFFFELRFQQTLKYSEPLQKLKKPYYKFAVKLIPQILKMSKLVTVYSF